MPHEAILQINKAEQAAETTLQNARAAARERVSAAHNSAGQLLAEARRSLSGESAAAAQEERIKAEEQTAEALRQARRDCDALRERAAGNIDAAVARIMERVMN